MKTIVLPLRTVDILREFTMRPVRTQPELQSQLGISPPTAFRAVDQLRELGVLNDGEGILPDGRGRPPTSIELKSNGLCVFALVVRSDETHLYVMDSLGQVQDYVRIPVTSTDPYETAIAQYSNEINRLLVEASKSYAVTAGIGVSFAGWVHAETGIILTPSKFLDWHKRALARDLSERTGLQCFVDNDAVSLTRATFWFSPKQLSDSFALLYMDFGLGTGFCFHNKIYTGQSHISAGLAHTNLFGWSNEPCHCGQTGCLETVLSIPSVIKLAQSRKILLDGSEPDISTNTLIHLEHAAQSGHQTALDILSEMGRKAGIVGSSICRMLDLPVIVFAGGLLEISEVMGASLNEEMERQSAFFTSPISWWFLKDALESEFPEALGASAVALGGLYQSRSITVLSDS